MSENEMEIYTPEVPEFPVDDPAEMPSTDELDGRRAVDDEADKRIVSAMLIPRGWYPTVPELVKSVKVWDEPGGTKREVASFYGPVDCGQDSTGKPRTRKFRFGVSPDGRLKDDGQPDMKSKLYVKAKAAYKKAYGSAPQYTEDIYTYLSTFPVEVNIIEYSDGTNGIVDIRAPRM